ncbi:MAG: 50S ribosomal protein L1 [Candidatus Helarchaeota archaeon]|nr:50S ribosomal protein L1 [Candidatus Helarchaeota archaeon]
MSVTTENVNIALEEIKKKSKPRKFTQTIDVAINLKELDLNQPQNRLNAEITLPHPIKDVKICVIAQGDLALRAEKAGADKIIDKEELGRLGSDRKSAKKIAKIFDYFIVGIDLMPNVGRFLGPVLGPLGKMPLAPPKGAGIINPKSDLTAILEKYKKTIRFRMKKNPVILTAIGNEKMEPKEIFENLQVLMNYLEEILEKGLRNIKSIFIKATMSSPVKINLR